MGLSHREPEPLENGIKERFDEVVKSIEFFSGDRWCFVVNGILNSLLQDGVHQENGSSLKPT
jgi:hypothetical protein